MVALTLLAVVVAVVHPISWTDEEMRFAVGAPAVLGEARVLRRARGGQAQRDDHARVAVGHAVARGDRARLRVTGRRRRCSWLGGRVGFGPLAPPPAPDDPIRLLDPPGEPPEGLAPARLAAGLPVVWVIACLVVLPVGVYIVSYIPWALIENHQLIPGWPPGHTGQTLLDLTGQMYAYHNGLTSAHPASSPWWAWPMNLKPVWFYQEGSRAGRRPRCTTRAASSSGGSGSRPWRSSSWMAFKRKSLALTLIAVGFAAQWIPWARIDRAAFQYHYYTSLPFV